MQSLAHHNPAAVAVYFAGVAGIAMFCMDPVILTLSLVGSLLYFAVGGGRGGHWFGLLLFAAMAIAGPVLSHNGVTVLFVLNHNPVTLEAVIYGVASAGMIVAVLYWFRSFTAIMTSDKLLYLFGRLSPRLALVLSMALRFVPLFGRQAKKINAAQRALGLYKDDNLIDTFRGGLRVFSVLITWGLEQGVVTADSMVARGYGAGRRTHFDIFPFGLWDGVLTLTSVALTALTLAGLRQVAFTYYPAITISHIPPLGWVGYAAYALLVLLPTLLQGKEALQWRCLRLKI